MHAISSAKASNRRILAFFALEKGEEIEVTELQIKDSIKEPFARL